MNFKIQNLKLKIFFLTIIFCGIFGMAEKSWAACVGPAQEAVVSAVVAATYGDTVEVCAGSATWTAGVQGCAGNTALCMKKGINLKGGIGGTTSITLAGAAPYGAILYEPDTTSISNDTPFEFSGFTVDANNITYYEGVLDVSNSGTTPLSNIKIHDNIFKNERQETINLNGPVYGVAYANTFIECETVIREEGRNEKSWDLGQREYGTGNNFFFEDNVISATTVPSAGAFSAGQGGSMIIRYNTYDLGQVLLDGNQWQDLHGLQSMTTDDNDSFVNLQCGYAPFNVPNSCYPERRSCEQWSQIKTEWYGNIHSNLYNPYSTPQEWMRLRGSWMLMFNNVVTGTGHMPLPDIYQYSCDSCQNGTGTRYSMHVQNTYVWNNLGNGTNRPIYVSEDNCAHYAVGSPYAITENVDYWNYNPNTLDGNVQKGINCGSAVPTSSCAIGDGYWQTSYSPCSEVPEEMGDMKTYTQAGRFYKCTAPNTWTLYYQPYTYPHPLRGGEDTISPTSPTGLMVN
ncbi:MAG: hypothetical protein WC848_05540 [Parcubacteria group bacterium]|jgi:hypothetical protein